VYPVDDENINLKSIKMFIENSADVNMIDSRNQNVLDLSILNKR